MTTHSQQRTAEAEEQQPARAGMGRGRWPQTKTGSSSLETIIVQRRQQNSLLPWSMSAVGGGIWVGFTFLELFLSLDSDDKCISLAPRLS